VSRWLQNQPESKLPAIYELVVRESGHKGINREGRGRVCGGQQVAGRTCIGSVRGKFRAMG
jgi:hypothetical protein